MADDNECLEKESENENIAYDWHFYKPQPKPIEAYVGNLVERVCLDEPSATDGHAAKNDKPSKDQDINITIRFIAILKESRKDVEKMRDIKDMGAKLIKVPDDIFYGQLRKVLSKLSEAEIKEVLNKTEYIDELKSRPLTFRNFGNMVNTDKPWDLKNTKFKKYQHTGVIISDTHYRIDVTGNVLFGYAGTAIGFSEEILLRMAGLAQKNSDKSNPDLEIPYTPQYTLASNWDDPIDQQQIKAGITLFKRTSAGVPLDDKLLDQVFREFSAGGGWLYEEN